jgi:cytochrome c oxidase assembly factor CtaG
MWSEPWNWEPQIVLPLAIIFFIYVAGAVRRGQIRLLRWRHASFFAGWVSLFLALTSPIHELGEQLFSAHMLQHEIMILVSAPLIAASQPGATCLWAFAPRRRAGIGTWVHRVEQMRIIRFLTAPLAAWLLEAVALWVWHIPVL